jgi:hypothetical protein
MLRRFLTAALGALALAGCGSEGAGPGAEGPARVTLLLTDAPGDVETAVVTIDEIYLQGGGGKTVLMSEPVTVDLLDLANSTVTLLEEVEIPEGTYQQLRFVISGGYIAVESDGGDPDIFASSTDYDGLPDGATVTGTLQMPSLGSSGLKVDFTEPLTFEGGEKILLVDFDVSKSFGKQAGQSGRWVMSPVIKGATVTLSGGVAVTATLAAGVTLPAGKTLADFSAVLDGTPVPFALEGSSYVARFAYELPGDHTLTLQAPAGVTVTGTTPTLPHQVTVSSGGSAAVSLTITGVTAAP